MWTVCITSIRHVLKLNGCGGRQAKVNGKSQCFKGWETLVIEFINDNFFMNLYAALATYCFFENKPEALPVRIEKSSQLGFF